MTKSNTKALFVLASLVFLMTSTFFLFPIKAHSKPINSQAINLTIYVTDQQIPGVENVTDAFLASPLGSGVTSVTVTSTGTDANLQLTFLQALMAGGTATSAVIGLDVVWTDAAGLDTTYVIHGNVSEYRRDGEVRGIRIDIND